MTNKSNPLYKCKHCNKEYKKESTLLIHQCEPGRRWKQQDDIGVRIGFQAWLRFYELTQGAKKKTYADFVKSPYYKAFVKFGWHAHQIRAVNLKGYIDFLIKENKKLDWWHKDRFYEEFLYPHVRKEHPTAALERAITEIEIWADESNNEIGDFFKACSSNRICQMIAFGRISPWIVFNCDTGIEFLSNLNSDQTNLIFKWIDPSYWDSKFKNYAADTAFVKQILNEAGFND